MERPRRPLLASETWRDVLWLHWPVPAPALRARIPSGLELDRFDGHAFVSIVAFRALRVRPPLVPRRLGTSFLEVNVRTYVHARGREPGVHVLEIFSNSRLARFALRFAEGLRARDAAMETTHDTGLLTWTVEAAKGHLSVECQLGGEAGEAEPGTLDHFLLERYYLHARRLGTLWTTRIHHEPFDLERARVLELDEDLLPGLGLGARMGDPIVHYAREVPVEIFWPSVHL
jgi:uncharacterized protein YqjF (DUF2071 family)